MPELTTIKEEFLEDKIDEKTAYQKFSEMALKDLQDNKAQLSPDELLKLYEKTNQPENTAKLLTLVEFLFEESKQDMLGELTPFFGKISQLDKQEGSIVTWDAVITETVLFGSALFKEVSDNDRLVICQSVKKDTLLTALLPLIQEENMDILAVKLIDNGVVESDAFTDNFLERHNIHERSEKLYEAQTGEKAIRIDNENTTGTDEIDLF